jgi:nicotinamidase/pyrazinamidase
VQRLETGDVTSTGLEEQLHERGIGRVVIVGLATDYCVKETGLDAVEKGFDATVLREAVRAVDVEPGDGERALEELEQAGVKVV